MSSDPTRPLPPEWNQGAPNRQNPDGKPRPTFTPNEQYSPQQPPSQQPPPQQPYQQQPPPQQPYQQQGYEPPRQGYEAPQPQQGYESPQQRYDDPLPPAYQPPQYQYDQQYIGTPPGRIRRRRRRWPIVTGVIVIVLLALAVGADRLACYIAENQMASQIQQNGLPVKPHVSINGFPFLTQLAAKDFKEVVISASNVTEGSLTISSINATMHGMHLIDGFSGAKIDNLDGSALITYQALEHAGDFPSGITLGPGSTSGQIKAKVDVPVLGDMSATVQVTKTSSNKFNVRVVNAGGIESHFLGGLVNYTFTVPQLPAGMSIQDVTTNQQGVMITIAGHNTTLTQSGSLRSPPDRRNASFA